MKSEEAIRNQIQQLTVAILAENTKYNLREKAVNWLHALQWVLEDEKKVYKDRMEQIERDK